MADQQDPWAAFSPQSAPSSSGPGSRLVIQQQMTPQDQAQMQHTQLENSSIPLQNANTQTNIQQGNQSIASSQQQMRLSNANSTSGIYKDFISDPVVKAYREVAPRIAAAETARHDGAGDNTVVYGWAKAMDPTGSVREGDTAMAQSASGPMQKAQFLVSQYHLDAGGTLPPSVRIGLIEEMRSAGKKLHEQYLNTYGNYSHLAHANGLDASILGQDPAQTYVRDEASYISSVGGTPRNPSTGAPVTPDDGGNMAVFNDEQKPRQLSPQQQAAEKAFVATNPTPEQYNAFVFALQGGHNGDAVPDQSARLKAWQQGGQYNAGIGPDPRIAPRVEELKQKFGTSASDAYGRGTANGVTLNAAGEISALGDTLRNGDPYSVNEQAQQQYDDSLQQSHPYASLGGEFTGGAVLAPVTFGAETPEQLAALSGGVGTVAGFNGGHDGQRGSGAVTGGVAGAALGYAIPKGLAAMKGKPTEVPPLVDPQTGQLNQPLEAMSPGQRVVKAEEYGINLPADAAGGRTAAVMGKGLDINPGSAGVMEDARRATESQVAGASDVVASNFGQSRTLNEAGSALQDGAKQRIERGKDVISKAYNAIPISDQAQASTSNTVGTLQQLTGRFQSNPELADAMKNPTLLKYQQALQSGKISWADLKDFRSRVGEMIGDHRFGEGQSTSDLRALYAGLSQDMQDTASAQGPRAVAAFNRANNLNRQNQQLVEGALTRILGAKGDLAPEKAAAAVQAMTKGGRSTGDLRTLAQVKAATVKSGAWNEVASTLIRLGGQPANSTGRDFNPQTFVNWYADMAEPARRMLFGGSDAELRKALDGFVAVNQRLMKVNALRNTSNTAGGLVAAGTATAMTAPITMAIMGHPGAAASTAAVEALTGLGGYVSAKLWTNPAVVRLMTGYSKAVASGSDQAVKSQIGRISALAATNPDLREPLQALQQRLLNAANDNVGRVAASPQNDQTNHQ